MQKDTEVFDSYIQQIYAEKDLTKILGLFKELVAKGNSIGMYDTMRLTIAHHFCILSDRFDSHPDILKEILVLIVTGGNKTEETSHKNIFLPFLSPSVKQPEEKKGEGESKHKIPLMAADAWEDTAMHYLAKRRGTKVIDTILKTVVELGETEKLQVNTLNGQNQTFTHILLAEEQYEYVQRMLHEYMNYYHFKCDQASGDGRTIRSMLAEGINKMLHKAIIKNDTAAASKIFTLQSETPDVVSVKQTFCYDELKISVLNFVAKYGSEEMFMIFFKSAITNDEMRMMIQEKDISTGCNLIQFACRECGYYVINELLGLCKEPGIEAQAKNGDTCLHSLVLNRRLLLQQKAELAKRLISIYPRLCNISNKAGQTPLVQWMFALSKHKEKDVVNQIIGMIATKTTMSNWKDKDAVIKSNLEKLRAVDERVNPDNYYVKERKALGIEREGKTKRGNKDLRAKRRKFNNRRLNKFNVCELVSPVEAAVQCKRQDWLENCFTKWNLSGNIITAQGRHVLGYALEFCGLEIVNMLIEKGDLKRYITNKDKSICFDMDGVFVAAFQQAYREMYNIYNSANVPASEAGLLTGYNEYATKKSAIKCDCYNKDYCQDVIGKLSDTKPDDKEVKARIDIINKAMEIYLKKLRIEEPILRKTWIYDDNPDKYPPTPDPVLKKPISYIPLSLPQELVTVAASIPECTQLVLLMIDDLKKETENADELKYCLQTIIQQGLRKGNIGLMELLDKQYPQIEEIISKFTDEQREVLRKIVGYTRTPEKIIGFLSKKFGVTTVLLERHISDPNCTQMDEWWYNSRHVRLNKELRDSALCDLLISEFFNYADRTKFFISNPLFLRKLVLSKLPSLANADEATLDNANKQIKLLCEGFNKMLTLGHHTLANDLLTFINTLIADFLKAKIQSVGCKIPLESEDFCFYFANFRKFMKKGAKEENNNLLNSILSKEDIAAMRLYSKHFSEFCRNITSAFKGHYYKPCLAQINKKLKMLYGLQINLHHPPKQKDNDYYSYSYSLTQIFSSNQFLSQAKEILSNPIALPYITYRCFYHKSKGTRRPLKSVLHLAIEREAFEICKLIIEKCPIIKPSFFYKLTLKAKTQPVPVLEIWTLALERLNTLSKTGKKGAAMKVLYELRNLSALSKGEKGEKTLRQQLYADNISNNLAYALIDNKYGYVLNHACRALTQSNVLALVSKYSLPLNVVSVELTNPYIHKRFMMKIRRVARPDLKEDEWLWYKTDIERLKEEEKVSSIKIPKEKTKSTYIGRTKKRKEEKKKKKKAGKPKKEVKQVNKKEPKYIRYSQYRVTSPFLELVRAYGNNINPSVNLENQVISLNESHKKLIIHEIAYYLSKSKCMTAKIYKDLWKYKEEVDFIEKIRRTEQLPIYEFVSTQGINMMMELLVYMKDKNICGAILNSWLTLACSQCNINLLMVLYSIKTLLGLKEGIVSTCGINSNYKQENLLNLYNLPLPDFCRHLCMTDELRLMWKEFFSVNFAALPEDVIKGAKKRADLLKEIEVLPVLALQDSKICIQYLEYIKYCQKDDPENPGFMMTCLTKTLKQFCLENSSKGKSDNKANMSVLYTVNSPFKDVIQKSKGTKDINATTSVKYKTKGRMNANYYTAPFVSTAWTEEVKVTNDEQINALCSSDIHGLLQNKSLSEETQKKYRETLHTSQSRWIRPFACVMPKYNVVSVPVNATEKLKEIAEPLFGILEYCLSAELNIKDVKNLLEELIAINSPVLGVLEHKCAESLEKIGLSSVEALELLSKYERIKVNEEIATLNLMKALIWKAEMDKIINFTRTFTQNPLLERSTQKLRYAFIKLLAERASAEPETTIVRVLLQFAITNGYKDVVDMLIPAYASKASESIKPFANRLDTFICYPIIAAVVKSTRDLSIVSLMVSKLPKPFTITVANNDKYLKITGFGKKTTFSVLEIAIFYDKPKVVEELLKINEYRSYAMNNAKDLAEGAFNAGNVDLALSFLKMASQTLTPRHMHIALQRCDNETCKRILNELLKSFSGKELLEFNDEQENNILHHIASHGRRDFLFALVEKKVFDYKEKEKFKEYLVHKNKEKCNPHTTAIQMDNLDIANAFYIRPKAMEDFSDEEFNIIAAPKPTTKALNEFKDEQGHKPETRLWKELYPKRDEILKLLEKIGGLQFYEKSQSKGSLKGNHSHHDHDKSGKEKEETAIGYTKGLILKGEIGKVISLILFRRDIFDTTALMPATFKIKENIYSSLMASKGLFPLVHVFVKLGFVPTCKEEIEPIIMHPKSNDEATLLLILQLLSVLKNNNEESLNALKHEPTTSLFINPYNFFFGEKVNILGTKTKVTIDELMCLIQPIPGPEQKIAYDLNIEEVAKNMFDMLYFKAFSTILLYTHKYNQDSFHKITSSLDTNNLLGMVFQENPSELPWMLSIMPDKFKLIYNVAKRKFELPNDKECQVDISPDSKTAASLIYYALHSAGKYLTLDGGKGTPEEIIRYILEDVMFRSIDIYSGSKVIKGVSEEPEEQKNTEEAGAAKKKKISKEKCAEINTAKRSLNIWVNTLAKVFEIMDSKSKIAALLKLPPEKLVISEAKLAEIIASLLNPTGVIFNTGNGFMTINVDIAEVMKAAKSFASTIKRPLIEAVSILFTDKYIFGVQEISDVTEKFVMNVKVKLISEAGQAPAQYKLISMTEGEAPAKYINSCFLADSKRKIYKKMQANIVDLSLTVNTTTGEPEKMPEVITKLNEAIKTEINISMFQKLAPISKKDKEENEQIYALDFESLRSHVTNLETLFYSDVSSKIYNLCKGEIDMLYQHLSDCYKECKNISIPDFLNDPEETFIPADIKKMLAMPLLRNNVEMYRIAIMTKEEWEKQKKPIEKEIEESIKFCTTKGASLPSCVIPLILPASQTLTNPEQWLIPEAHIQFLGLKMFAAEARGIRKITYLSRAQPPYIRVNVPQFIEMIAIPISQAVQKSKPEQQNTKYSNPLLITEEFFDFSFIFQALIKKLLTQLSELTSKQGLEVSALLVTFEEGAKVMKLPLEEFPLVDQIIHFTDCEIKMVSKVCTIKLMYENTWKSKSMFKVLPPGSIGSMTNKSLGEKTRNETQAYLEEMLHEVKVLESIFTETELLEKKLERKNTEDDTLSNEISMLFGKKITANIDWQSFYFILQKAMKKRLNFPSALEYYKYKSEFFRIVKDMGQQLTEDKIKKKVQFVLNKQIDTLFLSYLKSDARKSVMEEGENKNIGNITFLNPTGFTKESIENNASLSKCEDFYEFENDIIIKIDEPLNYEIYKCVPAGMVKANIAALKGKTCIAPSKKDDFVTCTLVDAQEQFFVFKKKGTITKIEATKLKKCYIIVTPELESIPDIGHLKNYFMPDSAGRLWKIPYSKMNIINDLDNYLKLDKLIQNGGHLKEIYPDKVEIKFYPSTGEVPEGSIKNKVLEVPFKLMLETIAVEPCKTNMLKSFPVKLFFYGCSDFRKKIQEFKEATTIFMKKNRIIPKKDIISVPCPFLGFNFMTLQEFPDSSYIPISYSISSLLDALLNAFNRITGLNSITQLAKLEDSLTYNMASYGNKAERLRIAERIYRLLIKSPIIISFAINDEGIAQVPEKLIGLDKDRLRLMLPIKCDPKTKVDVVSLLPGNYADIMHDRLIYLLVQHEISELKNALADTNKNIATLCSSHVAIDEQHPLKVEYQESIVIFNKAFNNAFPGASKGANKIKVAFNEKDTSLYQLRILLALPTLILNTSNALRLIKGLSVGLDLSGVIIMIKDGMATASKCWTLEKSSNINSLNRVEDDPKQLALTLLSFSKSEYLIPKETDILSDLVNLYMKKEETHIEDLLANLKCAPAKEGEKLKFVKPLLTKPGNYSEVYSFFFNPPYKPCDIQKEGLLPLISACLISLRTPDLPAEPVKLAETAGKLEATININKLDGLYKLAIRIAHKIIYTKVFMCYEPTNIPAILMKQKPNYFIAFASTEPGLVCGFQGLTKPLSSAQSIVGPRVGKYILYFYNHDNGKVNKYRMCMITEDLLYWIMKPANAEDFKGETLIQCRETDHGDLLPICQRLSQNEDQDSILTPEKVKEIIGSSAIITAKEIEKVIDYFTYKKK